MYTAYMEVTHMKQEYIVRSTINPAMILCTDGEYHAEGIHTGPGAWAVKVYKTRRGAEKAAGTDGLRKVEAVNG